MVEEEGAASSKSEASAATPPDPLPPPGHQAAESDPPGGAAGSACDSSSGGGGGGGDDKPESSVLTSDGDGDGDGGGGGDKSLGFADELMEGGSRALRDGNYVEATECFSRALEIRVAHYGELALECVSSYYKYGCALLYKAQEEADPLGTVPKKDAQSQVSDKDGERNTIRGESSIASVSSNIDQDGSSHHQDGATDDGSRGKDQEEDDDEDSDAEDLAEADEDESDLDLAWKMLDIARAILEKYSVETVEKVDILSALAEVALEREDIETSLSDYQKALSILEKLVEPDSRQIAEINFRICLCLEIGSKPGEAIPYCQKAISICKSRVQRLMDEVKVSSESALSAVCSSDGGVNPSSSDSPSDKASADKEAEIKTLNGLSSELEKKLEDLQQLAANPTSILTEILGIASAKAKEIEKKASSAAMSSSRIGTVDSNGDFDSPTASTAHTNGAAGVTHLGVVGRGVKRVSMTAQSGPTKKPAVDSSEEKRDSNDS
ncbi:hypothetical protein NL676_023029 [Syzygium grande]|nr:hypothetical protein NL676_023029 [Syzygium grande]